MPEQREKYEKPKHKLSDFFDLHWNKYLQSPKKPITQDQFRAVNSIRNCRKETLGVEQYACSECGEISEVYHACKHRFCPSCSWKDTLNWAEKLQERLLKTPHRHAVATLPHGFNVLLAQNYQKLNNLLLRTSAEAIKNWMTAKYQLTPGIISVLHTYGEKKNRHHHSHMIVSMGGLSNKTKQLKTVADKFIPYKFLSKKFRIFFEAGFIELFDNQELVHQFANRIDMLTFLKKINKSDWCFHFEPAMENAAKVIRYIGRYSKRACLSERKISDVSNDYISFDYKDYKDRDSNNKAKIKTKRMHYSDFFPTLLQHVPPKGYQIIRYYGVYANSCKLPEDFKNRKAEKSTKACTAYKSPKFCVTCEIEKQLINIIFSKKTINKPKETKHIKMDKYTLLEQFNKS